MPPLKIAVDLACLRLPFKQALLAAKRLGVASVEIDARGEINPQELSQSGRRQLRKLLDDLDLRVAAVGFSCVEDVEDEAHSVILPGALIGTNLLQAGR